MSVEDYISFSTTRSGTRVPATTERVETRTYGVTRRTPETERHFITRKERYQEKVVRRTSGTWNLKRSETTGTREQRVLCRVYGGGGRVECHSGPVVLDRGTTTVPTTHRSNHFSCLDGE